MKVEFYKHSLGAAEKQSILETLDSLFLTTGPKTKQFEAEFARFLGVAHGVGVTSCTAGLFLPLAAWNIGSGDKVIVPAMTFIATANVVLHAGAEVVFCDVEPDTGLMDLNQVEEVLKTTPNVKAIIPVHLYGQMVDMRAFKQLADKYGVKILEDCAHCIEGERDGVKPGQLGDAAAFSFYATKNLACGEGGAVLTNDANLAEMLRIIRQHGMSKSAADRHVHYQHWDMEVLGYKANMFDLEAALLLPQMPKIKERWQRREAIAQRYEQAFTQAGVDFPKTLPNVKHARHLFTIWAQDGKRDEVLSYLQNQGIGVVVNYRSVPLRAYYKQRYGFKTGDFPVAERIGERTLSLPLYPKLADAEVEYVIAQVIAANVRFH